QPKKGPAVYCVYGAAEAAVGAFQRHIVTNGETQGRGHNHAEGTFLSRHPPGRSQDGICEVAIACAISKATDITRFARRTSQLLLTGDYTQNPVGGSHSCLGTRSPSRRCGDTPTIDTSRARI